MFFLHLQPASVEVLGLFEGLTASIFREPPVGKHQGKEFHVLECFVVHPMKLLFPAKSLAVPRFFRNALATGNVQLFESVLTDVLGRSEQPRV